MNQLKRCIVCKTSKNKTLINDQFSNIVKCNSCGFVYDSRKNFIESQEKNDVYFKKGEEGHYDFEQILQREKGRKSLKIRKINEIIKFVKPEGCKLLDIGCSTGDLLEVAGKNKFRVFGVDISKRAVLRAKEKNPKSTVICGKFLNTKFKDNFFDVINVSSVLVHESDLDGFFGEVQRILKPGGFLFVDETNWNHFEFKDFIFNVFSNEKRSYKFSINFFTPKTLEKFINNLKKLKIRKITVFQYSDPFMQNYIPEDFRKRIPVKILLKLISISKIDILLGMSPLFEIVAQK